jgi:ubiquinone/menaquinone biosynthesis C-methylase UbiE
MEPTDDNLRAWEETHRRRTQFAGLPSPVRHALADLQGKRVLDLQCGTGESAAELAGLGATVTGVDSSSEALALARERWPSILWIQSDVQLLPRELQRGRFDLVYSAGVIALLDDLDAWAQGVASALQAGGDLLLYDEHPVATCVDGLMHWRESYFDESVPARLGQIVTAITAAGLQIRALEEYPQPPGNFRHQDARVPGTFLLHARRP